MSGRDVCGGSIPSTRAKIDNQGEKKLKLREACEIAESVGLRTVGEAVLNIEMHAGMFWAYEEMVDELNELVKEADQYGDDTSIFYILEGEE